MPPCSASAPLSPAASFPARKAGAGIQTFANTKIHGFTLLEILVVIVIIGVMAGLTVMTLGDNRPRTLNRDARKLYHLMHELSEEAVITQRELGLVFAFPDYAPARWDGTENSWTIIEMENAVSNLSGFIEPSLEVQGEEADNTHEAKAREGETTAPETPDIIFYSSGENSPFRLNLGLADQSYGQTISSNGLGDFRMEATDDVRQ